MIRAAVLALLPLAAAAEVPADYLAPVWRLVAMDGAAAEGLELVIGPDGSIAGQAPCNRFATLNRATLPELDLAPIGATRMACDRLAEEGAVLDALAAMTRAEVAGLALTLSAADGRSLRFVRPLY